MLINLYGGGGEFGQYKMMQKYWKMTELLSYGYSTKSTSSERAISDEYQHDRV